MQPLCELCDNCNSGRLVVPIQGFMITYSLLVKGGPSRDQYRQPLSIGPACKRANKYSWREMWKKKTVWSYAWIVTW